MIDTPTVGSLYGAAVSAPVFAQVAQQVLEYLGVPHDQPLKTKKELLVAAASAKNDSDGPATDNGADLNAMFAEVNNLPADDPLRAGAAATQPTPLASAKGATPPVPMTPPEHVLAAIRQAESTTALANSAGGEQASVLASKVPPIDQPRADGGVVVDAGSRVAVPVFDGETLRNVVERAGGVGLRVQPVGSGIARQQAPAAGTMVPSGTEIVVRFSR